MFMLSFADLKARRATERVLAAARGCVFDAREWSGGMPRESLGRGSRERQPSGRGRGGKSGKIID
jgi:hypothetical protein